MVAENDRVLIGVSGGPDSVCLLHVLCSLIPGAALRLGVAHVNHLLRGEESDADARFVRSLARRMELPCYSTAVDVAAFKRRHRLSLEEAGRRVRYQFLERTAAEEGFQKIATGHQSDDDAELILMFLLRGSGTKGLSGTSPTRGDRFIRPLIHARRSRILDYLDSHGLSYITDATNEDPRFLRNRIRHRLIPLLEDQYNPNITDALHRLARILRSEEEWMDRLADAAFEKAGRRVEAGEISLSVTALKQMENALARRVIRKGIHRIKGDLRRITFAHTDAALEAVESPNGSKQLDLPEGIRLIREEERLLIGNRTDGEKAEPEGQPIRPLQVDRPGRLPVPEIDAVLEFSILPGISPDEIRSAGKQVAFFDLEMVGFPLIIRSPVSGDRFQPFGMAGSQKLKDFFINNKIPRHRRRRIPLLVWEDHILWIIGFRASALGRVRPSTQKVLKVELFLA